MIRCKNPNCGPPPNELGFYARPHKRYHNRSEFDPPEHPGWVTIAFRRLWNVAAWTYSMIKCKSNTIYKNPYYWSLLKSILYFLFGMKLFHDMAKSFKADRDRQYFKTMIKPRIKNRRPN